jgi:N,N'-diacetyllegionaminate synthase
MMNRDTEWPSAFDIGGARIGEGYCFVIAEAGVNHNGDAEMAARLIEAAVAAGADAVKFQTFKADQVVSAAAPKASYQQTTTAPGESQLEMVRALELTDTQFAELSALCDRRGIVFLSTPFDHPSVELLHGLGMPAVKIPSGEITNLPLIRHIGSLGLPVILSTGMAYLEEVEGAVAVLAEARCPALAILHCVSNYPAAPEDTNLRAMDTLRETFGVPVGFSDHSAGIEIALGAVARGAAVIEKHFTLNKTLPGPDHKASHDPIELRALITGIRKIEAALGDGVKAPKSSENNTREVARRSLFLRAPLRGGQNITSDDLIALRPAGGIPPNEIETVVGRRAAHDLAAGAMLRPADIA